MSRKERRAKELARRREEKKGRREPAPALGLSAADIDWMATLLPAPGGRVLLLGACGNEGSALLAGKGWRVVAQATLSSAEPAGADRFDAIACWLVGTEHTARDRMSLEQRLRARKPIYELADRVLHSGAVLQVVDRLDEALTEALASGTVRMHQVLASVTSLAFERLDSRPLAHGALVSVRSRKP
jgi:hypothetical protein